MEPNSKGQIVIPKKIRDHLGIGSGTSLNIMVRDDVIHLYPVIGITTKAEAEISHSKLLAALDETRGMWADDKDFDKRQKMRRKIGISASRKRRQRWW